MENPQDFEARFTRVFNPTFFWGVGILELSLVLYTLYMELVTGSGPSLLSTGLPLSVIMLIMWAVLAALVSLVFLFLKTNDHHSRK